MTTNTTRPTLHSAGSPFCLCGCQARNHLTWQAIEGLTRTAPCHQPVAGCTGKMCSDPTGPCLLEGSTTWRPALQALAAWDEDHDPQHFTFEVCRWEAGLPHGLFPVCHDDGFWGVSDARFEITFLYLFMVHPDQIGQRYWIRDDTVVIGTSIDGSPEVIHTIRAVRHPNP